MSIKNLQEKLTETYATNFVAYTRSHTAHLNITGRNFVSDHKLLQKIYEDLQGNIDTLGELLRTIRTTAPVSLGEIMLESSIIDDEVTGDADDLLELVLADQIRLVDQYKELDTLAVSVGYVDISN